MRFSDHFLQEIRERVPISDVVGRRVQFDRRKSQPAKGDHWGCCPFHGEKTPSFHCEDRKGRYYCFGCQASGDHFRFLTELDGMSFPEAVEQLAAEAGLEMPAADPRAEERARKRASLSDVMALAARFFREQLALADGARARQYLRDRGLAAAAQDLFAIGYAPPGRSRLKEWLAGQGVEVEQMVACGLLVAGDDVPVPFDRFRDRVMFPILDVRERVIAFGGRALSPDVPAKYLNSPETELFHKGRVLFNHARARRAVADERPPIAVEGYTDVIALGAHGFEEAVAPLGTALTEDQLGLLWRMHPEPVLCFDGDEAGLRAAYRAADLALERLEPGRSVRFALLPAGQDPDDLLRASGPEAMRDVLQGARPLADLVWSRETAGTFDTPERKAALERHMGDVAKLIRNEDVRRHYAQDFRERLQGFLGTTNAPGGYGAGKYGKREGGRGPGDRFGGDRFGGDRFGGDRYGAERGGARRMPVSDGLANSSLLRAGPAGEPRLRETVLVMSVLHHPAIGVRYLDAFAALAIAHDTLRAVQSVLVGVLSAAEDVPEREALLAAVEARGLGDAVRRFDAQVRRVRIWQVTAEAAFEDARDGWVQTLRLHERARELQAELDAAKRAVWEDASPEAYERMTRITREIADGSGTEAILESFGLASGRAVRDF